MEGQDRGDADYERLRRDCGAIEVTRDVVVVAGAQAEEYLQGQCSQDLSGLEVGGATSALVLEPDGKLDALVRVLRPGSEEFVLETEPGFGPALAERLVRFRLRTKVTVEAEAWPALRLRGPRSEELVAERAGGAGTGLWVLPFEWGGALGVDLLGPGAPAAGPEDVPRCAPEAFEALRIESGQPVLGRELDERTIPAEAGTTFLERTVSFTKGCYTGQELVARLEARGNRVPRRLCGLVLEAGVGADGLAGAELVGRSEEGTAKAVGRITSAAWCPGLGSVAALGFVHRSVPVGSTVSVGPSGEAAALSGPAVEVRELPLVAGPG